MQRDPAGRETSGRASRRCRSARHPQMLISRVAISTVLDTGSLSEWDFAVELGDWWESSQWGRHTIRLSSIAQSDSAATTASAWAAMANELPRAKAGPSAGHGFVEERVRCRKVRSPLNDSANSDCLFEAFGHEPRARASPRSTSAPTGGPPYTRVREVDCRAASCSGTARGHVELEHGIA